MSAPDGAAYQACAGIVFRVSRSCLANGEEASRCRKLAMLARPDMSSFPSFSRSDVASAGYLIERRVQCVVEKRFGSGQYVSGSTDKLSFLTRPASDNPGPRHRGDAEADFANATIQAASLTV